MKFDFDNESEFREILSLSLSLFNGFGGKDAAEAGLEG